MPRTINIDIDSRNKNNMVDKHILKTFILSLDTIATALFFKRMLTLVNFSHFYDMQYVVSNFKFGFLIFIPLGNLSP